MKKGAAHEVVEGRHRGGVAGRGGRHHRLRGSSNVRLHLSRSTSATPGVRPSCAAVTGAGKVEAATTVKISSSLSGDLIEAACEGRRPGEEGSGAGPHQARAASRPSPASPRPRRTPPRPFPAGRGRPPAHQPRARSGGRAGREGHVVQSRARPGEDPTATARIGAPAGFEQRHAQATAKLAPRPRTTSRRPR